MLKFSPKKTLFSAIALASILVCGVAGGLSVQTQNEARQKNVKLRQANEMLAQYSALIHAAEVAYLRYLNGLKETDLNAFLRSAVQADALLKILYAELPTRRAALDVLVALSGQKTQRLEAIVKQRQLGASEADILKTIAPGLDRASSEAIAQKVSQIKVSLDSNILTNSLIYESQTIINRLLLSLVWVCASVLVVIFVLARYHWLRDQQLRLEEVEKELLRDRALNKAVEAEREKMVAYLGHDLDTLLTAILSSAEMLERQELSVGAKRYCDRILQSSHNMRIYLKELRVALMSRAAQVQLNVSEFDLVELGRTCLSSPAVSRHSNGHVFVLEATGEEAPIRADRLLLERAVINLLANAAKYSPNGGEILLCLNFGEKVTIEVCDEGLGVPEALLPKLFDPFQRGGNVGGIEGTGLGLAFVKAVAIAHKGTVEVFSNVQPACSNKTYKTLFRLTLNRQFSD